MSSFVWPSEDGWPYPDLEADRADVAADRADVEGFVDDDAMVLRAAPPGLFDDLDPLERHLIRSRFGLEGSPTRSMKQLQGELGLPRADLRQALGSGLDKLRHRLA